MPQSADWKRFDGYARRVHKLHYNVTAPHHKHLHHSVFDQIGRTRLNLIILPNLNSLEWVTHTVPDLIFSVLFMHDRVKHFGVWLPLYEHDYDHDSDRSLELEVQAHFQDIVTRMSTLTHLDLRMNIAMRHIEKDICELLHGLPKLQELILPIFHQTSRIMTELSTLEHLGVIQFEYASEQGVGDINDILSFSPTLLQGAFPSLWDLSLTASLADMTHFIKMPFSPTNLTILYIDCPLIQSAVDLHEFLTTVSENCQLLTTLHLELLWVVLPDTGNNYINHSLYPKREDQITFDVIRPLLAFPNLM